MLLIIVIKLCFTFTHHWIGNWTSFNSMCMTHLRKKELQAKENGIFCNFGNRGGGYDCWQRIVSPTLALDRELTNIKLMCIFNSYVLYFMVILRFCWSNAGVMFIEVIIINEGVPCLLSSYIFFSFLFLVALSNCLDLYYFLSL